MTLRDRIRHLAYPLAAVLALVLAVPATAAATTTGYRRYVALGDSYASGPFIPAMRTDPVGCARSDHNYPSDLERALDVPAFVDVSCGGATTADMTASQSVLLGSNPPQFTALTADTDLVTVTIGGNDIGFSSIATTCAELSFTDPFGNPCQRHYTAGGTDQLAAAITRTAPKIDAVLDGIRSRAPKATIVLVGYLRILPPAVGCWPIMPIAVGDVPYLDSIEHQLNAMLGRQAASNGVLFVNPGVTTGHDVCQLPGTKWVEGFIPTEPAFPIHPNARGMQHVADLVLGRLGTSVPAA